MRKKRSGFSLVGALLLLVAIGGLISTGYFVRQKHQAKHVVKDTQAAVSVNSAATPTYSGSTVKLPLFSLESSGSSYVYFVVPDGWVADKDSSGGTDFFSDGLTYIPGAKLTYSDKVNSRDIDRFMLSITDADGVPKEYKSYKKSDYGTVNGNKATLYYYEFSKGEHIGNVQMQGREKEYMYFITRGNDAVMVSYYIFASDKDQRQLIDQVVHTIRF